MPMNKKSLVLFQIDHKNDLRRYEIYECFQSYRKLMAADCGRICIGTKILGMGERPLSVIYFELKDVNLYHPADWDKNICFLR